MTLRLLFTFGLVALCAGAARSETPVLRIAFAGKTLALTATDLAAIAHEDFSATNTHEKQTHTYSGFPVRRLLERAGVPLGEKLRGPALHWVVVAHARDGYAVAYALTEFDPAFTDRTIMLVDRRDGQPLPNGVGALQVIIPADGRPARWIRMVEKLDVVDVSP
jgi:hypothetical protein